ncbi:DUF1360 domain-containing protein [Amphibacillus sediminis]|uniref:DUF1360 domain-containing protein n=1 Tax=Amphibacillus sediminis TaxID=360185 RepID=UPI000832A454|nr:DUF1360 domain-containing protein [Amphibacillus sediminis]
MVTGFEFIMLIMASLRLMRLLRYDYISSKLRNYLIEEIERPLENGNLELIVRGKGSGWRYHIGELYACHWCVSIWSALLLLLGLTVFPMVFTFIITILSIAAFASLIQFIIERFDY